MPKITKSGGSSYDGHVDVKPEDKTQPEWVPAAEVEPKPVKAEKPSPAPRTRAQGHGQAHNATARTQNNTGK